MDTFYLFMSPNRGLQPNGIYELRAVRSMQCTDIWANIPNWMPDAGPCFGACIGFMLYQRI
ncbi:hypothetical protein MUK42_04783 [Musa troglodytarum]|uniref:Uncharacterized protein n=1 Tax=Musa troglodytarum TaxID=320322 RepID=A0A9E7JEZ1_9LILI|nr:hypothetical protein MUK42_04783 [Musa troglodytarum]